MTNVVKLPMPRLALGRSPYAHAVTVRIVDAKTPKKTRWIAQYALQRAGGRYAIDGFNDALACSGRPHRFNMKGKFYARFLRDIDDLLLNERIEVRIDGRAIRPLKIRWVA